METEPEMRTRSFRNEDYNNRRAFLRSYPLYQDHNDDDDTKTDAQKVEYGGNASILNKKPMKKIIVSVFHWGGETVLIFRRIKHKVAFFVITCLPSGLKARTALISV